MGQSLYHKLDWVTIGLYLALVIFGWMNVFSSSVSEDGFIFNYHEKYIMDLIWIGSAMLIAFVIIRFIPPKVYSAISWPLYLLMVMMLVAVAFLGVEVNGSKSWFALGPIRIQPAEFSKLATSLLLAYLMGQHGFSFRKPKDALTVAAVLAAPMLAILLEKETGSALVYLGFLVVCYREGMTGWILLAGIMAVVLFILTLVFSPLVALLVLTSLTGVTASFYARKPIIGSILTAIVVVLLIFLPSLMSIDAFSFLERFPHDIWVALIVGATCLVTAVIMTFRRAKELRNLMLGMLVGIALVFSVEFVFNNVLKDHQRARIEVLLGIREDPMGAGYNVHQSLVAIGSGGFFGKGFLGGTQTRFNFVPEQSTDFIFCTVGEEWGFLGCLFVLSLYLALVIRILGSAEKQKDPFIRIFGWCVAMCLLMHVVINICMTIGLMPVIGIPLPLLSYGGSSLWTFTIMIFIYLRLDLERWR